MRNIKKPNANEMELLQYKKAIIKFMTAVVVVMSTFLSLLKNDGKEAKNINIVANDESQITIISNNK